MTFRRRGEFDVEGFSALLVGAGRGPKSAIYSALGILVVAETDPFAYVNKSTNFNFRDPISQFKEVISQER